MCVQHVTDPGSLTPCLCGLGTKVAFPSSLAHTAEQANNMSVLYPESRGVNTENKFCLEL